MRSLFFALVLLVTPIVAQSAGVTRAEIASVEDSLDGRLRAAFAEHPFALLGLTRGFYLHGYGVLFAAEVAPTAFSDSPFGPKPTPQRIEQIRKGKLEKLPLLRRTMREMLLAAAPSLDNVPLDEQIGVGITLFFVGWEDRTGVPSQIIMSARRRDLVDVATSRQPRAALEKVIQTREF